MFNNINVRCEFMAVFEKHSVICGRHHYQRIWTPEYLACERELTNPNDRYAVSIVKGNVIIGHLPRAQSKMYSTKWHY